MTSNHSVLVALLFFSAKPDISDAAHPLLTEDTSTQGNGKYQLELTHDYNVQYSGDTKTRIRNTTGILTLGLAEEVDLIFTLPHERLTQRADSYESTTSGLAGIDIGFKWRFYDGDAVSFAIRPGLGLGSGSDAEDRGFSRAATTSLYGAMSYRHDSWTFHAHVGYTRNFQPPADAHRNTFHGSIAAEFGVTEQLRFVGDVSINRSGGESIRSMVVGIIYSLTPDLDLDVGYRHGLMRETPEHAWLTGLALRF